MSATKRFMNWTAVSFAIAGTTPTTVAITGVSSVGIEDGGSIAKFSGDGDRYASTMVNDFNDPVITVEAADIGALGQLPTGTVGTFSATFNDARNKIATGAITYTFLGMVSGNSVTGKHRSFGSGTLKIEGYSPDGTTNPLSTSVAT